MNTPESENAYERKANAFTLRRFIGICIATVAGFFFEDLGWAPYVVSFLLVTSVMLLLEYWVAPKPPISFSTWALRIAFVTFLAIACLWILPLLLKRWLWPPLAFGVPPFLLFLFITNMTPLYPIRRKESFKKRLLFSIGFAIFYGWLMGTHTRVH